MKVKNNGSISLTGALSRNDKIRQLRVGDVISVRLIKATGANSAVLDIFGNIVNAEFEFKIPSVKYLELKLKNTQADKIFFQLLSDFRQELDSSDLFNFSIFEKNEFNSTKLASLFHHLSKGLLPDLFSITYFLFKLKKDIKNTQSYKFDEIYKLLAASGLSNSDIQVFSLLMANDLNLHYSLFSMISGLLGVKNLDIGDNFTEKNEDLYHRIVEVLFAKLDREDFVEIISLLGSPGTNIYHGKFLIEDNYQLKPVKYFGNKDSILLSLELSNLGAVEIYIAYSELINISLVFKKQEAYTAFSSGKESLQADLNSKLEKNIFLNILFSDTLIDKFIVHNKSESMTKIIDVQA